MDLQNNRGQILIEAVVAAAFMSVILIAFTKLIELKKNQQNPYRFSKNLNEKPDVQKNAAQLSK